MAYSVKVVDLATGREHALPADAVTRDAPFVAPACRGGGPPPARWEPGPVLPLGFRNGGDVFYVNGGKWPELHARALRLLPR